MTRNYTEISTSHTHTNTQRHKTGGKNKVLFINSPSNFLVDKKICVLSGRARIINLFNLDVCVKSKRLLLLNLISSIGTECTTKLWNIVERKKNSGQ